ncbi:hypothetical protein LSH36_599g00000, partial [Paralvinella palmiformis]
EKDTQESSPAPGVTLPIRLDFVLSPDVSDMMISSCQALDSTIQDLDLIGFIFDIFGKNIPKANKLSPDAFIQVALQLAYYRMYGQSQQLHLRESTEVIKGQGIDRHFLGLKLIALENGIDLSKLLTDPVFESSCYWQLSTSQVPTKSENILCFAPVVPDGYGVCYNPMEKSMLFAVSAWNSCPDTNAAKLYSHLKEALIDAQDILMQSQNSNL